MMKFTLLINSFYGTNLLLVTVTEKTCLSEELMES